MSLFRPIILSSGNVHHNWNEKKPAVSVYIFFFDHCINNVNICCLFTMIKVNIRWKVVTRHCNFVYDASVKHFIRFHSFWKLGPHKSRNCFPIKKPHIWNDLRMSFTTSQYCFYFTVLPTMHNLRTSLQICIISLIIF